MRQGPAVVWIAAVSLSAAAIALCGRDAARASAEASAAREQLGRTIARAADLSRLRSAAPVPHAPPASALPPRISAVLASCGAPPAALTGFSAEGPARPDARTRIGRQRASIALGSLTLPQVGRFLDEWRRAEPGWIVSSIELSPSGAGEPGGDLPLSALLSLEALVLDDSGGAR